MKAAAAWRQNGLVVNLSRHHLRQRSTVRRSTPTSPDSRCILPAVAPSRMIAISTTVAARWTLRPRNRNDGGVLRVRQPSRAQQKLKRQSCSSPSPAGRPRGLRRRRCCWMSMALGRSPLRSSGLKDSPDTSTTADRSPLMPALPRRLGDAALSFGGGIGLDPCCSSGTHIFPERDQQLSRQRHDRRLAPGRATRRSQRRSGGVHGLPDQAPNRRSRLGGGAQRGAAPSNCRRTYVIRAHPTPATATSVAGNKLRWSYPTYTEVCLLSSRRAY